MGKRLIIEIEFDEEQDEFDPDYTFLEFARMRVLEEESTLTEDERNSLAEAWSQSDWYSVGFVSSFLSLFEGEVITADDVRPY